MYIGAPRGCGSHPPTSSSAAGGARMTTQSRGIAAGADVGATLVKLAIRDARGDTSTVTLPADALEAVAQRLRDLAPSRLALTGCGAPRLAERLVQPALLVGEFEAWSEGARRLLGCAAP